MPARLEALITPEVLRWARESINMDAHEAASRIGVAPDRLADWEDGLSRPSVQQLRKASEVYRRPLAAFYLPAPPRIFHVPHDFRRVPDAQRQQYSPEVHQELRRAQYQRSIAVELAEEQAYPVEQHIGSVKPSMDPDDVAATLRSQLGIDLQTHEAWLTNYDAFNAWKNGMERVGVLVFHFEGVEVTEARGFSHPEFPLPFVAVNGKDSPLARAFTLLHEYCHLLINAGGVCDTVERTKVRGEDDSIETFCNHVAGAALVPSMSLLNHPLVRRHRDAESWEDWELRELSASFKASREVVLRRLLILGRASRVFYEQYREQLLRQPHKKKPFRFPYPRRVLRRIGQPYARTVIGAYYADRITGNELADYLGASLKHLPAIEALLEGPNVLTGGDR